LDFLLRNIQEFNKILFSTMGNSNDEISNSSRHLKSNIPIIAKNWGDQFGEYERTNIVDSKDRRTG
ncbi:unnamed protein product, partial [marine sediment metagenome]